MSEEAFRAAVWIGCVTFCVAFWAVVIGAILGLVQ